MDILTKVLMAGVVALIVFAAIWFAISMHQQKRKIKEKFAQAQKRVKYIYPDSSVGVYAGLGCPDPRWSENRMINLFAAWLVSQADNRYYLTAKLMPATLEIHISLANAYNNVLCQSKARLITADKWHDLHLVSAAKRALQRLQNSLNFVNEVMQKAMFERADIEHEEVLETPKGTVYVSAIGRFRIYLCECYGPIEEISKNGPKENWMVKCWSSWHAYPMYFASVQLAFLSMYRIWYVESRRGTDQDGEQLAEYDEYTSLGPGPQDI